MIQQKEHKPWRQILTWTVRLVILAALCVAAYFYRAQISVAFFNLEARLLPCRQPIVYSIGSFDNRFNVSQQTFLSDLAAAAKIWNDAAGKTLFTYQSNGWLKVNLIYDERQQSTQKLAGLGIVIDDTKASYDSLKAKYDTLLADYNSKKAAYDAAVKQYQKDLSAYNAAVASANARGGASPGEYARLQQERASLDAELQNVNTLQTALNAEADSVNTIGNALNTLGTTLNADVQKYNNSPTTGEAFTEGEYQSSLFSSEVDIYQFDNNTKLIRVLAHELGHALGLDHVSDPKAIMYYLNSGTNEAVTAADRDALQKRCQAL